MDKEGGYDLQEECSNPQLKRLLFSDDWNPLRVDFATIADDTFDEGVLSDAEDSQDKVEF